MIISPVGNSVEEIVAGIAESGTDNVARVLLRFAIEREHHFGMVSLRVAHAVAVADDELAPLERFLNQLSLVGPKALEI